MNDTYREEAAKLWLDIIHTYEDEPVRANASEVRAGILDSIAVMLRAIAGVKECERRIEAALSIHINCPPEERVFVGGRMAEALRGEPAQRKEA